MTEDEAKTKMCCGPPSVAASAYYRAGAACDAPMHCIASECMAWRWIPRTLGNVAPLILAIKRYREETAADLKAAKEYVETHPEYIGRVVPDQDGFCGLAGRPQ